MIDGIRVGKKRPKEKACTRLFWGDWFVLSLGMIFDVVESLGFLGLGFPVGRGWNITRVQVTILRHHPAVGRRGNIQVEIQ